jgi:hypothetical protein
MARVKRGRFGIACSDPCNVHVTHSQLPRPAVPFHACASSRSPRIHHHHTTHPLPAFIVILLVAICVARSSITPSSHALSPVCGTSVSRAPASDSHSRTQLPPSFVQPTSPREASLVDAFPFQSSHSHGNCSSARKSLLSTCLAPAAARFAWTKNGTHTHTHDARRRRCFRTKKRPHDPAIAILNAPYFFVIP